MENVAEEISKQEEELDLTDPDQLSNFYDRYEADQTYRLSQDEADQLAGLIDDYKYMLFHEECGWFRARYRHSQKCWGIKNEFGDDPRFPDAHKDFFLERENILNLKDELLDWLD